MVKKTKSIKSIEKEEKRVLDGLNKVLTKGQWLRLIEMMEDSKCLRGSWKGIWLRKIKKEGSN
jgi:hypothetical protein